MDEVDGWESDAVRARAETFACCVMAQHARAFDGLDFKQRDVMRRILAVTWVHGRGDGIKSLGAALEGKRA